MTFSTLQFWATLVAQSVGRVDLHLTIDEFVLLRNGPKSLSRRRGFSDDATMTKIIVGIDGSDAARSAFDWAYDQATSDDTLVAIHSWQIYPVIGMEAPIYNLADFEVDAHRLLSQFVEEVLIRDGGPTVEQQIVHGAAARVLVDESESADLVVVGSRGLGAFRGAMLGSVSTYVLHHAHCPIVVVPATEQVDEDVHALDSNEATS